MFADLRLEDAAEHLVTAGLVVRIDRIIRQRGLTQEAAAQAIGLGPSKLGKCCWGSVEVYPRGLLIRPLVELGADFEIVVKLKEHENAELRGA
ncbi:XRE family transcriptional regulator [Aetokthonos hydrillicola]|uniref:XRE family transcriptional regulator n=1 Tax=Aetokthonos hydrillicola TaxID=1550245 RepID=UPI003B75D0B4